MMAFTFELVDEVMSVKCPAVRVDAHRQDGTEVPGVVFVLDPFRQDPGIIVTSPMSLGSLTAVLEVVQRLAGAQWSSQIKSAAHGREKVLMPPLQMLDDLVDKFLKHVDSLPEESRAKIRRLLREKA